MTFPEKNWRGRNKGWEDRGEVKSTNMRKEEKWECKQEACSYCFHAIHIGLEDGRRFKFCPKCLVKMPNN